MFSLPLFTLIHVLLSIIGIISGLVVIGGFINGARLTPWIILFLITTILTSMTGFGFPFNGILPAHIVGALSLVVLAICLIALLFKHLEGAWRKVFVITAVLATYFNTFVLMAQLLQKTPALAQLAPNPATSAFGITQGIVILLFIWLGWAAVRGFCTIPNKG